MGLNPKKTDYSKSYGKEMAARRSSGPAFSVYTMRFRVATSCRPKCGSVGITAAALLRQNGFHHTPPLNSFLSLVLGTDCCYLCP